MKKPMDLFGEALYAYWKGDRKSKLFMIFISGKECCSLNLKVYFRKHNQLTTLEKKLISLARGNILDVGCATGYYIPSLMKKGKTEGIDISEKAIKVAKEMGLNNCHVANIFHFPTNKKYDTITLLQNNLGMAETLPNAKRMLKILCDLLKNEGQILVIHRKTQGKYNASKRKFKWNNKISSKFSWININTKFLSKLCDDVELKIEIIGKNNQHDLIRIVKK
ncbi:methyltransferase domain-containing protein [Candidatus Woesearchaeota archaeon]|nr:methyltransferase domain-containing protein [Candidatus Woesearchaeota archaeon]